jgi:hypothetical protein
MIGHGKALHLPGSVVSVPFACFSLAGGLCFLDMLAQLQF